MSESYGYLTGGYISASANCEAINKSYSAPEVGRITTQVVLLKAGYVGQVLVDGVIVRELKPRKSPSKALGAVNARVARRLAHTL